MMIRMSCAFALLAMLCVSATQAKELESGLQSGDRIGAFYVVKAAGAEEDGVPEGEELCYRCKLGRRPVVAIFARTPDKNLAKLVHDLDKVVAENADKKMASFVNLLGPDKEALGKAAKKLVEDSKAKSIAVVVPVDNENGPENMKLAEEADVTVLIYDKGIVKVNHAFAKDQLNEETIEQVIKDAGELLN